MGAITKNGFGSSFQNDFISEPYQNLILFAFLILLLTDSNQRGNTLFLFIAGLIGLLSIVATTREYIAAARFVRQGLREDLAFRTWYALNAQRRVVRGSVLLIIHLLSGFVIWWHGGLFAKIPNSSVSFGTVFFVAAVLTLVMYILKTKQQQTLQSE